MAIQSRVNYVGGLRIDLPDLLATDSYIVSDIRNLLISLTGETSYVVQGLEITNWSGLTVFVNIANALIFCPNNTVAPFYKGLSGDADLSITLQSDSDVYLELVLETTTGGPVTKGFWDSLAITADSPAGSEFTEAIDSQVIVVPKLVQRFGGFTPNSIKIAKITTKASEVESIVDSRELFFRLATGGAVPNKSATFPWDSLIRQEPVESSGTPSQLAATNAASVYYSSTVDGTVINDKGIKSFKDWLNAIMTTMREIKGTPTWYQSAGTSEGFPVNLSLISLFRDSTAGHSIVADPSTTIYWGTTTGAVGDYLYSQCTGSTRVRWQANYGFPIQWELGGSYSSNRIYSTNNFQSPAISTGESLYLALQRDVKITEETVTWRPSVSPGGSLLETKTVEGLGKFTGVAIGDYIKKESEGILSYYKVTKLFTPPSTVAITEGTVAGAAVSAVEVDRVIGGINGVQEKYTYFRSRYSNADLIVRGPSSPVPANDVDLYWLGRRSGDSFYFRDYGNLSQGEEVEVLEDGSQDSSENDFNVEPVLVLDPDISFNSSNKLAFNPNLIASPTTGTHITLYKRKSNNRINSSTTNIAIFSYRIEDVITLTAGQELWVKLSDDYSASTYVLSAGSVTDSTVTNKYEVRNPDNSPLRNYDNRNVFMLCKQITIGGKSYVVFFDGTAVGEKGRATPQRLQIEDVWVHDTNVDVVSTATSAKLFESANVINIGQSTSVTRIEGAQSVKRTNVSGTYAVLSTDHILSVDTSTSATLTLPAISAVGDGHVIVIKDRENSSYANPITINRAGSDKIDGLAASFMIQSDGASYVFVANAVSNNWEIV